MMWWWVSLSLYPPYASMSFLGVQTFRFGSIRGLSFFFKKTQTSNGFQEIFLNLMTLALRLLYCQHKWIFCYTIFRVKMFQNKNKAGVAVWIFYNLHNHVNKAMNK